MSLPSAHYDALYSESEEYRGTPDESRYYKMWKVIIEQALKPEQRILDVGCGPGQFARMCVGNGFSYVGLDFSKVAIDLAMSRVPEASFYLVDVEKDKTHIIKGEYDIITFMQFLEHINDDMGIIKAIPNGKTVIITAPNFWSLGHVRFFKNRKVFSSRYKPFLNVTLEGEGYTNINSQRIYALIGQKKGSD